MHVVNALAGLRPSVENQPIAVSHNLPLVGDAIRDGDQPGHKFMVLGPEVVDGGNMLLWNDQDVGWRDRLNILEGDHLVIAIDLASGYLTGEDLAEETVLRHAPSLAWPDQQAVSACCQRLHGRPASEYLSVIRR